MSVLSTATQAAQVAQTVQASREEQAASSSVGSAFAMKASHQQTRNQLGSKSSELRFRVLPESETDDTKDKYLLARHRLVLVWTWVGAILLAAVAIYVSGVLSTAIGIIIWTAIFVFILSGSVNFFEQHGVKRIWGTTISYILFIAVLFAIAWLAFSPSFGLDSQFEDLMAALPGYFESFNSWALDVYTQHSDLFQNETVRNWIDGISSDAAKGLQEIASNGAAGVVAVGTSIANIFICIGFALVVAFWILIELPNLGREVYRILGEKHHEDAAMLHVTVTRVMGGYLRTTIIQCTIIGIACGIMFAILGVPSPAAFGVITGLLNIIPIIGPWLGGLLAFVASFIESPLAGLIALVGTVAIQQIIYTFVSPKLMGDSVDIHPALTFIALMAGAGVGQAMGGFVGALIGSLLSIPLVAVCKSVFVYYFEKRTQRCIVAPDGVFFKGEPSIASTGELDPVADATALYATSESFAAEGDCAVSSDTLSVEDESANESA